MVYNSLAGDAAGSAYAAGSTQGAAGGDPFVVVASGGSVTPVTETNGLSFLGRAVEFSASTTSGIDAISWTTTFSGSSFRVQGYLIPKTMPGGTNEVGIISILAGGTRQVSAALVGSGTIRVRDGSSSAGTNVKTTTDSPLLVDNVYRVSIWGVRDATAGQFHMRIWNASGGDAITPIDLTGINTGSTNPDTVRVGAKTATNALTAVVRWQAVRIDDSTSQSYLAPEAAASNNKEVTISDGVGIADTGAQQVMNVGWSSNDPVAMTDAIAAVRAKLVELADGIGITDATVIDRSTATTGTRADALAIGDMLVQAASRPRSVGDAVGISDQLVVARNRVVTLADDVGIDDVETIIITKSSEGFSLTYFDGEQEYTVGLEFFFRLEDQG